MSDSDTAHIASMETFHNILSPNLVTLTFLLQLKVDFNYCKSSVPAIPPLAPPSISAFIIVFLPMFDVNFPTIPTLTPPSISVPLNLVRFVV